MKTAIIVVFALICCAGMLFADQKYYDEQEQIRRTAEKMVEYDRRQREEAKNRADKKEWELNQIRQYTRPSETELTGFPLFATICIGALPVIFFLWVIASALFNAPKTYPPGSTPESIGLAAMKQKERRTRILRRIGFWKPK
jgi:hypothetical protein